MNGNDDGVGNDNDDDSDFGFGSSVNDDGNGEDDDAYEMMVPLSDRPNTAGGGLQQQRGPGGGSGGQRVGHCLWRRLGRQRRQGGLLHDGLFQVTFWIDCLDTCFWVS